MSALAKFLAKLELENPFGKAQFTQLLNSSEKIKQMSNEASLLDKISESGFFGKTSGQRAYGKEWLAKPEIEASRDLLNREYARLDPDVEEESWKMMSEYPSDIAYKRDVESLFGKPTSFDTHPEYLQRAYNADHQPYQARWGDDLEPAETPDANFDAYGERRRRK